MNRKDYIFELTKGFLESLTIGIIIYLNSIWKGGEYTWDNILE
jgi:hypothetical protein